MTLSEILRDVPGAEHRGDPATPIDDLAYDSRDTPPGALFFCIPGARDDGHGHAGAAAAAGAAAFVVERWLDIALPQVRVPSVRRAMGPAAAAFFDHPSRAFLLAGVTGTNGKTTVTYLLERAFAALGWKTGLAGTVEARVAGETLPAVRTTPEAPDLQRLFARMRAAGVGGAALEVSSHGLAMHRIDGTRIACAIFTNLSHDHLDFHGTMDAYFDAKASLFRPEFADRAAINADDPHGRRLLAASPLPAVAYALERDAPVRARDATLTPAGSSFTLETPQGSREATIRLPGRYNVANLLAAAAAFVACDLPVDAALEGARDLAVVPGRMERIEGAPFPVLVDYAHTADSLEKVLEAARELTGAGGRLVCVFGCGGDRDRAKRPVMGRVAASLADWTVITSDNPRSEDPHAIIEAIASGARATGGRFEIIPDRAEAIRAAIATARHGDVIVIAGKGHETGQQFADRTVPFDDRIAARDALREVVDR